jgi:hypothetical protein
MKIQINPEEMKAFIKADEEHFASMGPGALKYNVVINLVSALLEVVSKDDVPATLNSLAAYMMADVEFTAKNLEDFYCYNDEEIASVIYDAQVT